MNIKRFSLKYLQIDMSCKYKYEKYDNTAQWIEDNLIYGDTYAWFIDMVPKDAIRIGVQKCAEHVVKLLGVENNRERGKLWNIIKLSCPFPGFVKKPNKIDLFIDNHIPEYVDEVDLLKAVAKDVNGDLFDYLVPYCEDLEYSVEDVDELKLDSEVANRLKKHLGNKTEG